MDWYFIKLAWKNIWRNKRRTLLTVNAIGFGVMALVALYNYYDGFHEQLVKNVIRYQSGHLVVTAPSYQNQMATQLFISNTQAVDSWLRKRAEVKASSHRITVQGLISTAHGSANIVFAGIEPAKEKEITSFSKNLNQGTYFEGERPRSILLGEELARVLKASIGSKVVALAQGVDGSIGNELFFVTGIFKTQSDFDKNIAFIQIADAKELLSLPPQSAHQIAIILKDENRLKDFQSDFRKSFGKPSESQLQVLNWKQVQKPLMAMIELNKSANRLLMMIIIFVASLGIANSILMSILERTREFGVMLAIGTTKEEVVRMVLLETFLLSSVGVSLGNILGCLVTWFFHYKGFDLSWLTSQSIVVQGTIIETVSYPDIRLGNSLFISVVVFFLSWVVSLIPIRHVTRLNPITALRAL